EGHRSGAGALGLHGDMAGQRRLSRPAFLRGDGNHLHVESPPGLIFGAASRRIMYSNTSIASADFSLIFADFCREFSVNPRGVPAAAIGGGARRSAMRRRRLPWRRFADMLLPCRIHDTWSPTDPT